MARKQKLDTTPVANANADDLSLSKKRRSSKIEDEQTSVKKEKRRKKNASAEEAVVTSQEKSAELKANGHASVKYVEPTGSAAKSFPLATAAKLPTPNELKSLSSEQQLGCFEQLGSTCERILRLMDDVQTTCGLWRERKKTVRDADEASAVLEDSIVADMAKLKGVPMARHFAEMTLWKRLKRFTDSEVAYIETLRTGEKTTLSAPSNDDESAKENGANTEPVQSEEFVSLKTAHLKHLTSEYADDLEKIRDAESLDVVGVQTLLKCLDESAALYATAMTFKKS